MTEQEIIAELKRTREEVAKMANELIALRDALPAIRKAVEALAKDAKLLQERRRKDRERKARVKFRGITEIPRNKETEGEKENLSPTPPIREKGEEKERPTTRNPACACACAGAREEPPKPPEPPQPPQPTELPPLTKGSYREPVFDVHTPPTLETLLEWCEQTHFTDLDFAREWFNEMQNVYYWLYPKTGQPIRHWPAYLKSCYRVKIDERHKAECDKLYLERAKQLGINAKRMGKGRKDPDNTFRPDNYYDEILNPKPKDEQ